MQVHRRADAENWEIEQFLDLSDELHLTSIGLTVALADIYRRIELPAAAAQS